MNKSQSKEKILNFSDIEKSFPLSVLKEYAFEPRKGHDLTALEHRIGSVWLFDFWRHIFRYSKELPKQELQKIWYSCFNMKISRAEQSVVLPGDSKQVVICSNGPFDEKLARHALTDALLIDNQAVRHRYCQMQKPGWKMLRYADGTGRRGQTLQLPDMLRTAIREHSGPEFCIALDMSGRNISFSLLDEILWTRHDCAELAPKMQSSLLRCLLENKRMPSEKDFPLPELVCYLVSQFPDCLSVPYLETVEEFQPGILKTWRDEFGRNLLWYTLYNMTTGWFHPACRLVPFLLEQGCDPGNENQIGLSWQYITEELTPKQKEAQMTRRYRFRFFDRRQETKLSEEQPLRSL